MFHVDITEGRKILRKPRLRRHVNKLTVCACKEETVLSALRDDGRFHDAVFAGHELLDGFGNTTGFSVKVDHLGGVTVKIQLSSQPHSQPQSHEDDGDDSSLASLEDDFGDLPLASQSSSQQDSQPQSLEDEA